MEPPTEHDSIRVAKQYLREHIRDGVQCPCCTQRVQMYHRPLDAGMASRLIVAYRLSGREEFNYRMTVGRVPGFGHPGDFAKLRYWGLIDGCGTVRDDGSSSTGDWQITARGEQFVRRAITVPKYVDLFDSVRYGEPNGDPIDITAALRKKFDYAELMAR